MTGPPRILAERIAEDIAGLAALTEPDLPYTRRSFTPMYAAGREWLTRRFEAAGLAVRVDEAGNLIGLRPGSRPGSGRIMAGSHSDTVPGGGRFDGIAGIAAALEVARALADEGIALSHDLEIVDFLAEEVSVFGLSCIGSRGMTGQLTPAMLSREARGTTLAGAIASVGGRPEALPAAPPGDIAAFFELHIEQGRVLESAGVQLGIVTAIAGITRFEIVVEGRADHAGTTPMSDRRDALAAAARLILAVEAAARRRAAGPAHFAATAGELEIVPNAANVVPGRVRLLVDARAERRRDMEDFASELEALALELKDETGLEVGAPVTISDNLPTPMAADVVELLRESAEAVEAGHRLMASGAGHDAAWMARATKAGMLFVPCREGRSHTPEEWAETADIALGAAALAEAVQRADGERG